MEINKGIEAFDERTDFTRNNPDRKPWGRSGTDSLDVRNEYDVQPPNDAQPPSDAQPPLPAQPPQNAQKFTHKLANGTVLEAATVEDLASQIEKAAATPAPPVTLEFEDKPLYTPYEFKPKDLSLQEQADILNLWKENPQAALRKLQEADLGVPATKIIEILHGTQQVVRQKLEEEAGAEFLMEADTYSPTPANGKKLTAYLKEKGKPITKTNLLVAFNQLVAAGDKALLRAEPVAEVVDDKDLEDVPAPPVIVPSNQGTPPTPQTQAVDAAKFAAMPLDKQREFFKNLKRVQ